MPSHLLQITPHQLLSQVREIPNLHPLRSHKNPMLSWALKIPLRLPSCLVNNRPVVFPRGFIKRDTDPWACAARDLGDRTDVEDGAAAGVGCGGEELAARVESDA